MTARTAILSRRLRPFLSSGPVERQESPKTASAMSVQTEPAPKRNLGQLRHILRFVLPSRAAMAGAFVALTVAAGTVLGMGIGLRRLVDDGFSGGNAALLD